MSGPKTALFRNPDHISYPSEPSMLSATNLPLTSPRYVRRQGGFDFVARQRFLAREKRVNSFVDSYLLSSGHYSMSLKKLCKKKI